MILCLSAIGARRLATSSVVDDFEPAVELGVGEARVHVVTVGVNRDAGGVELPADVPEVIERGLEPPRAKILARLHRLGRRRRPTLAAARRELRLEMLPEQFALTEAAVGQRLDDHVHGVGRAGRPRHIAEAVGLRSEPHPGDFRIDRRLEESRQRHGGKSDCSEFASCDHQPSLGDKSL